MSLVALARNAVSQGLFALGDLIRPVQVAGATESEPQPGVDYEATWTIYDGRGAFEKVQVEDYPNSTIMIGDRTLLLFQCARDVEMHDFVRVDGQTYHVYGIRPDIVGSTRILQKLLLRPEQKAITWVSTVPLMV